MNHAERRYGRKCSRAARTCQPQYTVPSTRHRHPKCHADLVSARADENTALFSWDVTHGAACQPVTEKQLAPRPLASTAYQKPYGPTAYQHASTRTRPSNSPTRRLARSNGLALSMTTLRHAARPTSQGSNAWGTLQMTGVDHSRTVR